jgi:hydroxymethylpyrimidine pyrophosphatase-like HAD family hydrolase
LRAFCESTLARQCRTETYRTPDGTPHALGIYAPGADKGSALQLVLDRLGVTPKRAMAIGDNPNDVPMFARVARSVAMGNAPRAVRDRATVVAPDNDAEGVAWALEQFALGAL